MTQESGNAKSITESLAEFGTTDHDLARIFGAIDVGLVVQQADFSITACNAAAERILGLTADQIAGRTSQDPRWRAIREDGSPFVGDQHPAVLSIVNGESYRNVLMGIETPEGDRRWLTVNSDPIIGEDGKATASVTTFADITAERLARAELDLRYDLENASFTGTQMLLGLHGEEFDLGVEATLGAVAEVIGADRAYIMYVTGDEPEFRCTHEWCAPGVPAFHRSRPPVPTEPFLRLSERSREYETIDVPATHVSPSRRERDQQLLEERGCEAFLLLPMHSSRGLVGMAGFDQITARPWPDAIRPELRSLIDGLTNFIENRRLEAVGRSTEARYRLLAEQASDLVLSLDVNDTIVFASPSAESLLGRAPASLVGSSLLSIVYPEDFPRFIDGIAGESEPGESVRSTLRLGHADGRWIWFEASARRVVDPETGQVSGTNATLRDVSDREAAFAELREREARLRLIAEENPVGIVEATPEGVCEYVNPTMARMIGRRPEDLVGTGLASWVDEDAWQRVVALADDAVAGRAGAPIEVRSVRPDGIVFWAVVRCVALRNSDGSVRGILGTAEDITQRKAAEEALRLSEERFRAIVQNATDIITLLDADGTWRYSSPGGFRMLGWPEGYDPDGGIFSLVHPDDVETAARAFSEVRSGARSSFEPVVFRVRHVDGHYVFLETTGQNLIDDPAVNGILLVSRDVTERLRDQEALATARDAALAALQAKREFIAVVSHELRTPMHAVLGLSELLSSSPLDEEQRLYIESIQRSVRSLSHVVDDILDYTRAEAGRLDLHPRPFSVRSVVSDVATLLTPAATEKQLTLEVAVAEDVPVSLVGDPDRIRQLLTNLVGNAVKYTDAGSVHVEASVHDRGADDIGLRLAVRDTGIGIASEQLERLFEPFEQGEGATWRRHGGTGLGLAICRQLVQLMGGDITVDSTVGFGSEFVADLRLGTVEAPRMTVRVSVPRRAAVGTERPRVLVVEDNEVNQLLVDRQLATLDYDATIVGDGPTALDRLREERWDAVLLDVQLPGMDGLDVARKFRGEEPTDAPRTPVIAMTASAMAGDRDACLAAGMDDYLSKPVGIEPLRAMLDRWVRHRDALPLVEPAQPGGSLESLATDLGGDRDTVTRMATTFLAELPQRRDAIARASDAATFAAAAHTLASASAALSLTGLFNACRAAEQAAKQGQQFDRGTHEQAIDAAIARSVPTLEEWLAGGS